MQVTLSVGGRFNAFYLARQLFRQGYLRELITSYPKSRVRKYGIPKDKISSIFCKEILERGWNILPLFLRKIYNPQYFIHHLFDCRAADLVSPCDICVAWSAFGLYTIRKAKGLGALTIIDEGSSHVLYQYRILQEEYAKYGIQKQFIHPKIIEKELNEYAEADYIAIPSFFVKRTFLEQGIPESKLIHIPYGADFNLFKPALKEDRIFRIIHCGQMTLRKGIQYLLQAFYELNLPHCELCLIGAWSEEAQPFLKQFNRGKVFYKGPIPQEKLYQYYAQGSVFVLASIEEGQAYVLPQAMACGLPVICTENTGGSDLIREGKDGFIIPIRDISALKEKILYFYEHEEMRQMMAQNAREHVQEFSWDTYAERTIEAYQRLSKNGPSKI